MKSFKTKYPEDMKKGWQKNEGSYLSFVTNSLIYFKAIFSGHALRDIGMMTRSAKCMSN